MLSETIIDAENLTQSDFTAASWTRMQTALRSARNVYNNVNAAQNQVDASVEGLSSAIGALGAESQVEILECEITVIPMINNLPVYSRDMYLHIIFDSEEIIKVVSNLPEDLESLIESRENIDYFSEDVLQSEVFRTFDDNEVSHAYYFTETNELIPVYVAVCTSYERVIIFRADTGEEIQF